MTGQFRAVQWTILGALLVGGTVWMIVHSSKSDPPKRPAPTPGLPKLSAQTVKKIHHFCGVCHEYPSADVFPRRYWRHEVERGFGFAIEHPEMKFDKPSIEDTVRYYQDRAPRELAHVDIKTSDHPLNVRFEKIVYPGPKVPDQYAISNVNLVHLPRPGDGKKKPLDILATDMAAGLVMTLRPSDPSPSWKILARISNPARTFVTDLDRDGKTDILVANLGSFPPTDDKCGSVVWMRGKGNGEYEAITLLDKVGRVSDVRAADFRGTGELDLVVSVFGWKKSGQLIYLKNVTTDWGKPQFEPRVLDKRHGAIHTPLIDLNGDGKMDFIALIAQEHEVIIGFINDGKETFRRDVIYKAPHPAYGSSGIELADLDADGKQDILYTNGDILDPPYLFKPYHSVQWLKNMGQMRFEHQKLSPMVGAHAATSADVTGDGRRDVLAVSFLPGKKFPDREERKSPAILLFEQNASSNYETHVLSSIECDHATCALGDLYGTGRQDLVVGNFNSLSMKHPITIWKNLGANQSSSR